METSHLAPRVEPISLGGTALHATAPDALSTRADTSRPVLAAARPDKTRAAPPDDFRPLDTFAVGDNDHVPVPPEPPRASTVLAMMAQGPENDTLALDEAPSLAAPTAHMRDFDGGFGAPGNPTVDIRR